LKEIHAIPTVLKIAFYIVNSSMSDFRQMYIKKQSKILLDSSTDIHRELVCKYLLCNNLLNIYLKREILTKSARVRYKMSNELWEVKMKSEEMKLTSSMKTFLQVISKHSFVSFVLCNTNVSLELSISTKSWKIPSFCKNSNPLSLITKGILKRSRQIEHSISSDKKDLLNVIELDDTDSEEESSNQNTDEEKYDTLILNFVLSLVFCHWLLPLLSSKICHGWSWGDLCYRYTDTKQFLDPVSEVQHEKPKAYFFAVEKLI
jgi:hypothetical protein